MIAVSVEGKLYPSIASAARAHRISRQAMWQRVRLGGLKTRRRQGIEQDYRVWTGETLPLFRP